MATRCVGFREKATNLKGNQHKTLSLLFFGFFGLYLFRFSTSCSIVCLEESKGHVEDLEAKLKAAEKALEEAHAKVSSGKEKMEELKSRVASREAEICLRLDALNASFVSKFPNGIPFFDSNFFACPLFLYLVLFSSLL